MIDQADRLRQLARQTGAVPAAVSPQGRATQRAGSARVIAVTSGKGGVGKSVITVNLALALARLRRSVIVFDADFGLANADVLLNIRPSFTLAHVIDGVAGVQDCLVECAPGVRLLPGGSGVPRLADMGQAQRETVLRGLSDLETRADYILIDTGAGISRNVVSMVMAADETLVVTTPEPTAVTDAYAMIKLIALQDSARPVRVLVNMAMQEQEAEAVSQRIREVCLQFLHFSLRAPACVPMDAAVALSVRAKQPFMLVDRNAEASRCLYALAQELARQDMLRGSSAQASGGFFSRLAGIFSCAGQGDRVL